VVTIYDPSYSTVRATSAYAVTYLFQGMRYDTVSGLYASLGQRWYSATLERWTSLDPTGYSAGDVDLYRFVGNGPLDAVDPSGMQQHPPIIWDPKLQSYEQELMLPPVTPQPLLASTTLAPSDYQRPAKLGQIPVLKNGKRAHGEGFTAADLLAFNGFRDGQDPTLATVKTTAGYLSVASTGKAYFFVSLDLKSSFILKGFEGERLTEIFRHERLHLIIGEYVAALCTDNLLRRTDMMTVKAHALDIESSKKAVKDALISEIAARKEIFVLLENLVTTRYDDETNGGKIADTQGKWETDYQSKINKFLQTDPVASKFTVGWKYPDPVKQERWQPPK
jgi:RHS repeat-associated protein